MNGTRIYFLHIIKASRKWCINKLIIYLERFQIKMIFKIAVWDIHVDVHTCITCTKNQERKLVLLLFNTIMVMTTESVALIIKILYVFKVN